MPADGLTFTVDNKTATLQMTNVPIIDQPRWPAVDAETTPAFLDFKLVFRSTGELVKYSGKYGRMSRPEFGNIIPGVFTPVLAKHSKSFNLIDTPAVGVDRIQRNLEPMQRQVEHWRQAQITDERAKLILYSAFVDGELDAPRSLLPEVHRLYFEPEYNFAEFD